MFDFAYDPHPNLDRRLSRSENTQVALSRLLEATRRSSELEALALADELGLLVAGAGAAELCDELAAAAPFAGAANDTRTARLEALDRRTEVRRLAIDGVFMFVCGRGGDLPPALGRAAAGCTRILVGNAALER